MSTNKTASSSPEQENALSTILKHRLNETLYRETVAMAEFALSTGKVPDPALLEKISRINDCDSMTPHDTAALGQIHRGLARLVSPATPNSIRLLQSEKARSHLLGFLGPVPLVRHLTTFTLLLLVIMVTIGLSPMVNYDSISHGILYSDGLSLFLNLTFLLACAGLGASFSALYHLNRFIGSANYDPKFDSTYWTKIILGIIAGLFMVELVPVSLYSSAVTAEEGALPGKETLVKPAIALLGGFSATMVYQVLQRLVDSIESFVKGDQRSIRRAREQLHLSQLEHHRQEIAFQVVTDLKELEEKLHKGDTEGSKEALAKAVADLLPATNKLPPTESD